MCTLRRTFAQVLVWSAVLAGGLSVGGPASGQNKGGGKPKPPPPPDIPRPLCFCGPTGKNPGQSQYSLLRVDLGGESYVNVNAGIHGASWPRWSPDGSMIGGYYKVVDDEVSLMVMNRDATGEKVVLTAGQFNAWNLSRPGVLASEFLQNGYVHNCWLGNSAFLFSGRTTYDASFFGGTPGTTVTATRLFIVDAGGTITPLTEMAALGTTVADSSPHWSAALDKIVFLGTCLNTLKQLFAINRDGTGLIQITNFGSLLEPNHAVWSPTGDRLAMMTSLYRLVLLDVDLSLPNPGAGEGGRVTAVLPFKGVSGNQENRPSWSPDGRRIGYCHSQGFDEPGGYSAGSYILIADVETGAEKVVTGPKSGNSGPDWDPLDFVP